VDARERERYIHMIQAEIMDKKTLILKHRDTEIIRMRESRQRMKERGTREIQRDKETEGKKRDRQREKERQTEGKKRDRQRGKRGREAKGQE
jgi:hypothetical protein